MKEIAFYFFLAFTLSALLVSWFITLTSNHYQRGYRDGYTRGKVVASERFID